MFSAGMWGAMWIVQVFALASIQGCVEPVYKLAQPTPTTAPTATAPTATLTPVTPATPAPTKSPINMNVVTAALRALVNSPVFLNKINDAMRAHIPNTFNSQNLGGKAAEAVCLAKTPRACLFGKCTPEVCLCTGNYDISANLQGCSGLKTIQLLKLNALDSSDFLQADSMGNMKAVIGAEVGMGYVECVGTAQANVNACGIRHGTSGTATLGVSVKKMSGQISAKLVQGTGDSNQFCLEVTKVVGNVNAEDIQWKKQQLQLHALPVQMPNALTQTLWARLPTSTLVDTLEVEAMKQLQDALQNQPQCY
jgi:hypothetical protein